MLIEISRIYKRILLSTNAESSEDDEMAKKLNQWWSSAICFKKWQNKIYDWSSDVTSARVRRHFHVNISR